MATARITTLGYALMGLINEQPRSGYDLHRLFVTTPIGHYSGSPGAVYPALARLKEQGLIAGRRVGGSDARPREEHRLTSAGREALCAWLRNEPTAEDVARRVDVLMLRFGFMDQVLERDECAAFLERLVVLLGEHVAELKRFLRAHRGEMRVHGGLAMECGVMGYESQLRWAKKALVAVKEAR